MIGILDSLVRFYREATVGDWLGLMVATVLFSSGIFWYAYFGNLLGLIPVTIAVLIPILKYLVFHI